MLRTTGAVLTVAAIDVAAAGASEAWTVRVRETAGIERFKYPVSAQWHAGDAVSRDSAFELRDGEKPVEAQFTPPIDDAGTWSVDFHVDLAALETRELSLRRVDRSKGEPAGRRGLTVERAAGEIHVRHPSLQFVVNDDLGGLFERIDVAGDDYLVSGAGGLSLQLRDGRKMPLVARRSNAALPTDNSATSAGSSVRIMKAGPLAAALAFDVPTPLSDTVAVRSTVVLSFPLGKSWVRVDWTLDDPADAVAGVRADLQLRLEADDRHPALADVGANGWTYAALRPGETLAYWAGATDATAEPRGAWRVDRVRGDRAVAYAVPAPRSAALPPQGWAHLMDGTRATAIAVDEFAAAGRDAIELSADGALHLARDFSPADRAETRKTAPKHFAFWLHVVRSPPQVGAATSPQSMQAPPEVRIVHAAAENGGDNHRRPPANSN